ncbi:diaminopropionate ammonia-lyase, partial [Gammaproteobacteria bacterium]|nr:diaminopropionate ammonia-lyase [Gammaproteobacteria bacterium]
MSYTDYAQLQRIGSADEALELLGAERMHAAWQGIRHWPGYAPTPLASLDRLAADCGVAEIGYKDESGRFGLGSFKALGGAWAVQTLSGQNNQVVASATDGNHGRSVAWGAQRLGIPCHIFIHRDVSAARAEAIAAFGATIHRIDGNYDDSVRICAEEAAQHQWTVVSDTTWPGYETIPREVMAGYTLMIDEALQQMATPTHVFVQAGVGGLAAAVAAGLIDGLGTMPTMVVVEADRADCFIQSVNGDTLQSVHITEETIMAGLSCGEPSILAWDILQRSAEHYLSIPDDGVAGS